MTVNVHANIMQQSNGQPLSQPNPSRSERLLRERPRVYNEVVRLLAEPREHVSYREICRRCHVTDDTVKAVEKREAIPIAARKEALMVQAARIAKLAYDRVEDQIDSAPLPQAVVAAGVFTDKFQLLSGDATARVMDLSVYAKPVDLVAEWNKFHEAIRAKVNAVGKEEKASMTRQLALPGSETIADSRAETGLEPSKKHLKTS
jgi:hypothetical protein